MSRVDEDVAAWTRAWRTLERETLAGFGADVVVVDDRALLVREAGLEAAGFVAVCRAPASEQACSAMTNAPVMKKRCQGTVVS